METVSAAAVTFFQISTAGEVPVVEGVDAVPVGVVVDPAPPSQPATITIASPLKMSDAAKFVICCQESGEKRISVIIISRMTESGRTSAVATAHSGRPVE